MKLRKLRIFIAIIFVFWANVSVSSTSCKELFDSLLRSNTYGWSLEDYKNGSVAYFKQVHSEMQHEDLGGPFKGIVIERLDTEIINWKLYRFMSELVNSLEVDGVAIIRGLSLNQKQDLEGALDFFPEKNFLHSKINWLQWSLTGEKSSFLRDNLNVGFISGVPIPRSWQREETYQVILQRKN